MEEEAVHDAEHEAGGGEDNGGEGEVPVLDGHQHAPGPPLLLALAHPPRAARVTGVAHMTREVSIEEASFLTGRSHYGKNGWGEF